MKIQQKNFTQQCYELLKTIPKGKVTTYGEIARALKTKAYRAVGNAMAKNKQPIIIPCHRVVKSNGEIGNYALGLEQKINLLSQEGITIKNGKVQNFEQVIYQFR